MNEKIVDIVEIRPSYATPYVDLGLELFDDNRNMARMTHYRPVASHRLAFEKLGRALNVKDRRCYLLTGSYGTGKSHLCLMLANYVQTPAGEAPMPAFFENYVQVDPTAAEVLRAKRDSGRYLVALCQWGGRGDFEEVVLRAVDEALRREGFADDFDTHYLQAIKKIEDWQALDQGNDPRGRFYADLQTALQELAPSQTIVTFTQRLREFDYAALEEFKRIHLALTTAPFTYDKSNLVPILTGVLSSEKFKQRFLGVLVLFDEFGDTMERGNLSPKMFQQFAQLAAETPGGCARLIFVGTAHKALTNYAKAYNATEFRTASDRIEEVGITPDGVEDIISAIVSPRRSHPLWEKQVASRSTVFDAFLTDCNRLKLFDWLKGPKIRTNIIENIYPLHPMATHALLQLSRDIASNNRSVYTFFAGDLSGEAAPGSFGWFIANTPIEQNGKLNLYTADLLCDYFASSLSSDNRELRDTIRDAVKDYENSRRELNRIVSQDMTTRLQFLDDPLIDRILRLMLVYDIIGIPNRLENLAFGLYRTTTQEKTELVNRLKALSDKGILYYARDTQVYEFKKSKGVDLDRLIEDYKKEPKNEPANIVAELTSLVPLDRKSEVHLEARDYNLARSEDKRLERRLVRPLDLGTEVDTPQGKRNFFQQLEAELKRDARRSECEGFALYAVCQTAEEIQKAIEFCARNQSDRIVVAVPRNPVPLLDAVMELRALQQIETNPEYKNYTHQDKTVLNSRLNGDSTRPGAFDTLRVLRAKLMNPKEVVWYARYAAVLPVDESKPYDAANRVMEQLYSGFANQFSHDDYNKLHLKLDRAKNAGLKEAVEKLLDYTQPLMVDASFAQQRGDIRYLQKCLLNNGALQQVKSDGNKLHCDFEPNLKKYQQKLPSLAAMITEIQSLAPAAKLNLAEWMIQYRQPPYGQGPVSLALSLAYVRRAFGDSIRIKSDENAIGELALNSFDVIVDLIEGRYPNAFLSYRPLRDEERLLTNLVFKTFGQPDSAAEAARDYSVMQAYNAVRAWWEDLPPLARIAKLYPNDTYPFAADFIGAVDKIAAQDAHTFLFDSLAEAFGASAGLAVTQDTVALLTTHLPQVKQTIEGQLQHIEERILDELRLLFHVQQHTYSDIIEAITTWYNSLDSNQRDPHAPWHDNDSKPLVIHLKTLTDLRETFLDRIPSSADYGMKRVPDWMADRVTEYVGRLRRGKQRIDDNQLKVDPPVPVLSGDYTQSGSQVSFRGALGISFKHKGKNARIYIVEGNADPTDPTALREEVKPGTEVPIRDNKTLHYVVQDADGNWGRVETLTLVNEHRKFELSEPRQKSLKDQMVSCVFPQDPVSFAVTCRSLFAWGLQRNVLTLEQLEACVQEILKEMEKG